MPGGGLVSGVISGRSLFKVSFSPFDGGGFGNGRVDVRTHRKSCVNRHV